MRIVIVGGGQIGTTLASMLSAEKHRVSVIESNEEVAKDIAEQLDALVIHGDATNIPILKDAGIEKANAVISATADDKTNLMVCEIAKSMKTEKIISRVNDPDNEDLFKKLDIVSIVPIVELMVTSINRLLKGDQITFLAELGKGKIEIIDAKVGENSGLLEKKPGDIKNAIIAAVYRDGETFLGTEKDDFKEGDVVTAVCKASDAKSVTKLIAGE